MGNKQAQRRISARRAATFLAALGALVMSSGVALMVAATPANAVAEIHKSYVCKYVNKAGGGTELAQTGQNPIWVDNRSISGKDETVKVGDKFTDKHGYSVVIVANTVKLDPEPTVEDCGPAPEVGVANADAAPNTPTCKNNVASYSITEAEGVETPFAESAAPAFNTTITLTATASSGFAFPGGASTKEIPVTFGSPATGCDEKQPLTPQEPTFTPATCTANASVTLPQATQEFSRTAAGPSLGSSDAGGVHYAASGSLAPGGTVVVEATLNDSDTTKFADGATTSWTYPVTAPSGCTKVSPPAQVESQVVVSPPKAKTPKAHAATVTPTLVEAGLAGTTQDLRGQQGLALMVAGMVMLVAAGGLGLRVRGAAARS